MKNHRNYSQIPVNSKNNSVGEENIQNKETIMPNDSSRQGTRDCWYGSDCKFSKDQCKYNHQNLNKQNSKIKKCSKWITSGFCDHKSSSSKVCYFYHPEICKSIKSKGECNDATCELMHPKNICHSWIDKGYCLCNLRSDEDKLCKYHPKICINLDDNHKCEKLHPINLSTKPENLDNITNFKKEFFVRICEEGIDSFMKLKDNIQKFLEISYDMIPIFLDEIIKKRNVEILKEFLEFEKTKKKNFIQSFIKRNVEYSPYNVLVWHSEKYKDTDASVLIEIANILFYSNFKIFLENSKYEKENLFKAIIHPNNRMSHDKKNSLINHFYNIGDDSYWLKTFIKMSNVMSSKNTGKMIDTLFFIFSKCPKDIMKDLCIKFMSSNEILKNDKNDKISNTYSFLLETLLSCKENNSIEFCNYWNHIMDKNQKNIFELQKENVSSLMNNLDSWKNEVLEKMKDEKNKLTCLRNYSRILSIVYSLCKQYQMNEEMKSLKDLLLCLSPINFYSWLFDCELKNSNLFIQVGKRVPKKKTISETFVEIGEIEKDIILSYINRNNIFITNEKLTSKDSVLLVWLQDNGFLV